MNLKILINLILGVLGILISWWVVPDIWKDTSFKVSIGLLIAWLVETLIFLISNWKRWRLYKTKIWKRNQPVRVTIAYLFRIEINGSYILIKRHKKDRVGYQPIGGAFKYFKDETRECFNELGVEPCNHVARDEDTDQDLRVQVRERKKLIEFLKWVESRKNREVDPWREFYEELVEPGLLPEEHFKHIKYVFIGKHEEGIIKSPVFSIDEFRYAEIYELKPENDYQRKAIADLIRYKKDIVFAKPEEIRRGSTDDGKQILPHTFKILPK